MHLSSRLPTQWSSDLTTSMDYGTTSTRQQAEQSFVQYEISESLWTVSPPVVLLLGTFGNVMTVLIMRALKTDSGSDPSMCVYFPCLAVCDQTVLTVGLSRQWVKSTFHYDVRILHVAACKLHKFVVFAVGRMATWILVAVTTQRVMMVVWPLRQRLASTKKKAIAIIVVIIGACLLLDAGILVLYSHLQVKSGKIKCRPVKDSHVAAYYEDEVYPWLNITTGSLLPLSILVVNNVILGWKVHQSAKLSCQMTNLEQAVSRNKQASSLSLTLIVTSFTYFLLTSAIPAGFFVKTFYLPTLSSDAKLDADVDLADAVLDLLWYCNSAVNFYLYFLTGPKFRNEAKRLLCSARTRRPRSQPPALVGTASSDLIPASSTKGKKSTRY